MKTTKRNPTGFKVYLEYHHNVFEGVYAYFGPFCNVFNLTDKIYECFDRGYSVKQAVEAIAEGGPK